MHFSLLIRALIIPTGEMKETVHNVERELTIHGLPVLSALPLGGVGTHQNLAMMEGNDIRRRGIIQKIGVHLSHALVRHNRNLDLLQSQQRCLGRFCGSKARGHGCSGSLFDPLSIHLLGPLVIVESQGRDTHAAEAGGGFLLTRRLPAMGTGASSTSAMA